MAANASAWTRSSYGTIVARLGLLVYGRHTDTRHRLSRRLEDFHRHALRQDVQYVLEHLDLLQYTVVSHKYANSRTSASELSL